MPIHKQPGEGAGEVTRIFISSTKAMNTFCDDVQKRKFFVPAMLLRSSDLTSNMAQKEHAIQTVGNKAAPKILVCAHILPVNEFEIII